MIHPALISLNGTQRTFNQYSKPKHELGQEYDEMGRQHRFAFVDIDLLLWNRNNKIGQRTFNQYSKPKMSWDKNMMNVDVDTGSPLSTSICSFEKETIKLGTWAVTAMEAHWRLDENISYGTAHFGQTAQAILKSGVAAMRWEQMQVKVTRKEDPPPPSHQDCTAACVRRRTALEMMYRTYFPNHLLYRWFQTSTSACPTQTKFVYSTSSTNLPPLQMKEKRWYPLRCKQKILFVIVSNGEETEKN